jgi:hypothetical protein
VRILARVGATGVGMGNQPTPSPGDRVEVDGAARPVPRCEGTRRPLPQASSQAGNLGRGSCQSPWPAQAPDGSAVRARSPRPDGRDFVGQAGQAGQGRGGRRGGTGAATDVVDLAGHAFGVVADLSDQSVAKGLARESGHREGVLDAASSFFDVEGFEMKAGGDRAGRCPYEGEGSELGAGDGSLGMRPRDGAGSQDGSRRGQPRGVGATRVKGRNSARGMEASGCGPETGPGARMDRGAGSHGGWARRG